MMLNDSHLLENGDSFDRQRAVIVKVYDNFVNIKRRYYTGIQMIQGKFSMPELIYSYYEIHILLRYIYQFTCKILNEKTKTSDKLNN